MKSTIFFFVGMLAVFSLVSCESEQEQHERLNQVLKKLQQDIKLTEQMQQQFLQEQKTSWQCSTKERFAHLAPLTKTTWQTLAGMHYITGIQFMGATSSDKLEQLINLKIQFHEPEPPRSFVIYLYNQKGLLLGYAHEPQIIVLPRGQCLERQYKARLDNAEEAKYYWIEFLSK